MTDPAPLTYCTNIHPGESWADVLRNVHDHALIVKQALAPNEPFPLGVRLSAQAACELDADEIGRFNDWCAASGLYVLTLNGFPHGAFHGTAVKRAVYQPDWRDPARAAYTRRLADVLARWTPPGNTSSISTVPVAFADDFSQDGWVQVRANLLETLKHLASLHENGGPLIRLALEPEPGCVLERIDDVPAFFERMAWPEALANYIGICFDCCHQAVEFEDSAASLRLLADAGVRIVKVQVTSALRAVGADIANLLAFDEPTYLHQAVLRTADERLLRFNDLPELGQWLARGEPAEECRVHFHVPVFLEDLATVGTTRAFLEDCLPRLDRTIPLEVETYSFNVLPPDLRLGSVADSLVRELGWVREQLDASHGRH